MRRRHFFLGIAMAALCACATHAPVPFIRIRLSPTAEGYDIRVNEQSATLPEVGDIAVAHAMAANPGLTAEEVRATVRLQLIADRNLPYRSIVEVMSQLQAAGFTQLVFVAEDRR